MSVEAQIQRELAPGETLEAIAEGTVGRAPGFTVRVWAGAWLRPGELLARPAVVALTSQRVLVFRLPRFSNRLEEAVFAAKREEVRAQIEAESSRGDTLGRLGGSNLIVITAETTLPVYIDRPWEEDARRIAAALGEPATD